MTTQPNTPASRTEQAVPSVASGVKSAAVDSPFAYRPYCLNCEKEGHRTRECHSTYAVNARSNEIDNLAAPSAAIAAREQEVAWLVEPNALSHPKMKRQLTFDRPHERGDWTVTPLGRLRASTVEVATDIVDRCDRFTPEEIYAEGRHDQWLDDKALIEASRTREYPPLPKLGEGRLYVMSPSHTGEVMTLDAVRAYVDADRLASRPEAPPASASTATVAQPVEDERRVTFKHIGAVPESRANDRGIVALERMAASIGIISKRACWDHVEMFEVRDALCDAQPCASQEALTDDQIDRLQEEYDCFGQCDAPRIHDFARGVEKAVRTALSTDKGDGGSEQ